MKTPICPNGHTEGFNCIGDAFVDCVICGAKPIFKEVSITDQAATVLAEIDAQLAICEKATAGPWAQYITDEWPPGWIGVRKSIESDTLTETHVATVGRINDGEHDAAFIASARTVCPKSLRCLKTEIEGLLKRAIISPPTGVSYFAETRLTNLMAQWNENK